MIRSGSARRAAQASATSGFMWFPMAATIISPWTASNRPGMPRPRRRPGRASIYGVRRGGARPEPQPAFSAGSATLSGAGAELSHVPSGARDRTGHYWLEQLARGGRTRPTAFGAARSEETAARDGRLHPPIRGRSRPRTVAAGLTALVAQAIGATLPQGADRHSLRRLSVSG